MPLVSKDCPQWGGTVVQVCCDTYKGLPAQWMSAGALQNQAVGWELALKGLHGSLDG